MNILEIKTNVVKTEKIEYAACVKCRSDNIEFYDCGYSTFNCGYSKCKNCGYTIKVSLPTVSEEQNKRILIKQWNDSNDIKKLKEKYQKKIIKYQKKIDNLPKE